MSEKVLERVCAYVMRKEGERPFLVDTKWLDLTIPELAEMAHLANNHEDWFCFIGEENVWVLHRPSLPKSEWPLFHPTYNYECVFSVGLHFKDAFTENVCEEDKTLFSSPDWHEETFGWFLERWSIERRKK